MAEQRMVHLLGHERRIWRKFLASPPFPLDQVVFDLRLGEGAPVQPEWAPEIQHMARVLTQKRVDVLAISGLDTWILEIKERAGLSALGQLLGYGTLYVQQFNPVSPPRLGVIAEDLMSDIGSVLQEFGISVFLV